jgi:pyruvate/2-oxoglutarate dehydrogenase complex dihydrolipoamide dehydrogenase (E3) component
MIANRPESGRREALARLTLDDVLSNLLGWSAPVVYEGGLAAENALTNAGHAVYLTAVPGVVFTEPQVTTVGCVR